MKLETKTGAFWIGSGTVTTVAFLLLCLGGIVYLLWRPDSLLMFRWAEQLGCLDGIDAARDRASGVFRIGWTLHSLPHGTWTFSGTSLMGLVWRTSPSWSAGFWIALIPAFSIFGEFGQFAGFVPGCFDVLDLFTAVASSILAVVFVYARRSPCFQ